MAMVDESAERMTTLMGCDCCDSGFAFSCDAVLSSDAPVSTRRGPCESMGRGDGDG